MTTKQKQIKKRLDLLKNKYEQEEQQLLNLLPKEVRFKIGKPIKEIHYLDTFLANQNKYIVGTSLSINRFKKFEEIQVSLGFGIDFTGLFNSIRKSYDYLNARKAADASVTLYNIMNGIRNKVEERENEVLLLCTLFIYREGEDLSSWDENLAKEKIKDWEVEGIGMDSFFSLAHSLVTNFIPILNEVSKNISQEIKIVRGVVNQN